jgi:hypothetical protein
MAVNWNFELTNIALFAGAIVVAVYAHRQVAAMRESNRKQWFSGRGSRQTGGSESNAVREFSVVNRRNRKAASYFSGSFGLGGRVTERKQWNCVSHNLSLTQFSHLPEQEIVKQSGPKQADSGV